MYHLLFLGFGKVSGIGHEGCDEYIQASKMNGKTVSFHDKVSGDFMIQVKIFIKKFI